MNTVTSKQVRADLPAVEKLLKSGPVSVTKRGREIFTIHPPVGKWTAPDFTARAKRATGNKYRNVSLLEGVER